MFLFCYCTPLGCYLYSANLVLSLLHPHGVQNILRKPCAIPISPLRGRGESIRWAAIAIAPPRGVRHRLLLYSIAISPLSAVSDRQAAGAFQSLYATYGGRVLYPSGLPGRQRQGYNSDSIRRGNRTAPRRGAIAMAKGVGQEQHPSGVQ